MSDPKSSQSWWATLPGIITSLTAIVTALAGLVIAINQTGWFGLQTPTANTTVQSNNAPPEVPVQNPILEGTSPAIPTNSSYPVTLPTMREYRLGYATFTLLNAEISQQTMEKDRLRMRVRMMNHESFPANFWNESFRLIVNGVPMAPEDGLNENVPAQSAKEGDVIFILPHDTTAAKLKIMKAGDSTEIPLVLVSSRH